MLFYPYAFSGVCTGEMAGIRDRLDEFMTFDTEVMASPATRSSPCGPSPMPDGLNFPLLSDFWPHGEVARAYDVFDEAQGCPPFVLRHRQAGPVRWAVHNATLTGATSTSTSPSSERLSKPRGCTRLATFPGLSVLGLGPRGRIFALLNRW